MAGNISTGVMPVKGMNKDTLPGILQEGSYCHALNMNFNGFDNNGKPIGNNEPSNLLNVVFPIGFKVTGFKRIPEMKRTLFMLSNRFSEASSIYEVRDHNCVSGMQNYVSSVACGCDNYIALENTPLENQIPKPCTVFHEIISNPCLNFDLNYPIRIQYDIIEGKLYFYFTDNLNERRFIYFELDSNSNLKVVTEFHTVSGFDSCGAPTYSNVLDCNKIKVQPNLIPTCITYIDEVLSGGLRAGVYQFFTALATPLGRAMSEYSSATNEIPIFNREITFETNYETDKGISLIVNGYVYNTIHKYYNIVVAKTIDNVTTYELVATLPISSNTFHYTGNDKALEQLSESDVYQRYSYYKTAENITSANGYLFWHGMKEYSKGNWQRVANNIILNWQTTSMPLGYYKKSKYAHKYRTYPRDEVVPFGIIIGFTNGEETNVLHIPNRIAATGEDVVISNADSINLDNCGYDNANVKWNLYNTAAVTATPHQVFNECQDSIWERGTFAYWESSRRYPNDSLIWGDLCNTPIRHHKFPNCKIAPLHDNALNGNNTIYPIGVVMDHVSLYNSIEQCVSQGLITEEQKNRISYYRIVRGNRAGNKSIIAKGLIYDMNMMVTQDTSGQANPKPSKTYFYPNYPFNDLRPDSFISNDFKTYLNADSPNSFKTPFVRSNRYTFHSPDTHFRQPTPGNFISLESLECGIASVDFREVKNHAKFKFLTTLSHVLSLLTGTSLAMSEQHRESKTLNRKDYWYSTTNDEDNGDVSGSTTYTGTETDSSGNVTAVLGTDMYNLNTSNSKKADWNTGRKQYGQQGNKLAVRDYGGYNHLQASAAGPYGEETFTQITGDKYDFLANPTGGTAHKQGLVYGEKQNVNPLYFLGFGANRITTTVAMSLVEAQKILAFIESLIPLKNLAVQYQAVGTYNYSVFSEIVPGNTRRYISDYGYLSPEIQHISEKIGLSAASNNIVINNWHRETSLYLKAYGDLLTTPSVMDNSRQTMSDFGYTEMPSHSSGTKISAYYASLKANVPDQYGSIYDIEYIETGHCPFSYSQEGPMRNNMTIFGGDTFINAFALKRKHSFFNNTAYGMPNESDWFYEDYPNVGYPSYYFNTKLPMGARLKKEQIFSFNNMVSAAGSMATLQSLLGVPKNRLDLAPFTPNGGTLGAYGDAGELFYQKGYIYTWAYGIPNFIVESDVNLDFRHGVDFKAGDFYPRQKDLDEWLQEKNVPIKEDNQFHYNSTYSKQNRLTFVGSDNPDFKPNDVYSIERPNELIYSLERTQGAKYDPWLVYYPLNRKIFDNSNGRLISADGIENDKVLCRFENNVALFNAYVTLQTSADVAIIGTGGMFQTKPQEFNKTDLGYIGSQHKALLKTEFGHIGIDAKRGTVWMLGSGGSGIVELSNAGMRNWFSHNLPFQLGKDFQNMELADLDNILKGIGITMVHDKLYHRILITKKDYKVVNKGVKWDSIMKTFYIKDSENSFARKRVSVNDPLYFCNRSWTIGYAYEEKEWIGFYSFVPNFYIGFDAHFQTGLNSYETEYSRSSVWDHVLTNKSFQVFYGKLEPFEVDIVPKSDMGYSVLNHIGFKLDVWRYHNDFDKAYMDNISFNKAVVYNERQCSGLLNLVFNQDENLSLVYPMFNPDENSMDIKLSKDSGIFYFNQFTDRTKSADSNIPIMLHSCNNARTYLNLKAIRFDNSLNTSCYIRSDQSLVRLINDKYSNYRFVLRWLYYDKQKQ